MFLERMYLLFVLRRLDGKAILFSSHFQKRRVFWKLFFRDDWLWERRALHGWQAIFHCDPDAKEFVLNRRRISPFYLLSLLRKYNINFPAYYLCFLSSFAIPSSITNYLRAFYCLAYWIRRSIDSHCNWIWWWVKSNHGDPLRDVRHDGIVAKIPDFFFCLFNNEGRKLFKNFCCFIF